MAQATVSVKLTPQEFDLIQQHLRARVILVGENPRKKPQVRARAIALAQYLYEGRKEKKR